MTPNPNPSPRDLLAQAYQDNGDLGAAGYIRSGHDLTPDTQIALLAIKDALALSPQTLPAPGEVEARAAHIAAYSGPVVSFDVTAPYYLASCDSCGWVGSSEHCGTDTGCDDSNVYCPRCDASGADCGKIATHAPPWTAATVAAANDEGDWVLVPREITQAMLDATCATDADDRAMRAAWPELIRTAPKPLATSRSPHEGASS